jgi:DNA-3-methyladenine glycosylase II
VGAHVMFDHPAWVVDEDGTARRAARSGESTLTIVARPDSPHGHVLDPHGDFRADVIEPPPAPSTTPLTRLLGNAGPVIRVANPDLWDALATGIVRQVIRAGQARLLYREFSRACGEHVETSAGPAWLFPSPENVLSISDSEFSRLGMAFKARPLRAAAEAYLLHQHSWSKLGAADLVTAVQRVPRIGPWTAGAAVADATNDFSLYPYADLAVRTWAKRLDPARAWPDNESEFAAAWRGLAGEQLSDLTLLTLAWGVRHAATQGAAAL